ncbi:MAG TPA: NUDIX hydrolase [Candidatus Pacearchaeota archaeon]|nr:NUDIX hydrolase [Candidatus Pacearchaeota archaeon]HOK94467.1 NUDIX hydrolase [Candidatus Pacearchaeota archaeon]HPO75537.1 NUDIX hydrolase [Candidatus Pacearchaeota archaeon]
MNKKRKISKKPRSPILTVSGMILNRNNILLVKRAIYPFLGYWTLPGGHVEYGETTEHALKREMKEELGISVKIKELFGVYSNPKRDPRYHTVSVVYLCEKRKGKIKLNFEASEFQFFSINKLPSKIGFDYQKVLQDLKKKKKDNLL